MKIDYNEIPFDEFRELMIKSFFTGIYLKGLRHYLLFKRYNSIVIRYSGFEVLCVNTLSLIHVEFSKETMEGKLFIKFICTFDPSFDSEKDKCDLFQFIGDKNLLHNVVEKIAPPEYIDTARFDTFYSIHDIR